MAASPSPRVNSLQNRLGRLFGRFRGSGASKEAIARWQALQAQGDALERLMATPEWAVLEQRKQVHQRLRDLTLHAPDATDQGRKQAALEWHALEEWFRDLRRCIREGQQAREALSKVKAVPPPD